ncbi:MAG TPA: ABC transporter ATP-binding protein [Candidatus Omnitrophota bacterium]|nr:ABC transporter ATP-binding protein [Candidatus Omnitrophota bacterium]
MPEPLFELKNAGFSYLGKFSALKDISLNIKTGESIVILGANGSGKSTLLSIMSGLAFLDSGSFKAFGRPIDKDTFNDDNFRREFRQGVGLLFQNSDIQLFCSTVEEELYFGPLQLGMAQEKASAEVENLSNLLGIKKLLQRSPHQLSIGEKRKVAIASILAVNPQVLLLDEPTAGLDAGTCTELIDLILEYHQQAKTIITATHDLHIAQEIADTIYIFNEEKSIAASGSCADILSNQELLLKHNLAHIHTHRHDHTLHKHLHSHP